MGPKTVLVVRGNYQKVPKLYLTVDREQKTEDSVALHYKIEDKVYIAYGPDHDILVEKSSLMTTGTESSY